MNRAGERLRAAIDMDDHRLRAPRDERMTMRGRECDHLVGTGDEIGHRPARRARLGIGFDEGHAVADQYGTWVEKSMYGKTYWGNARATFVIDENGVIELARYNVKATGHVASLKKALKFEA